MSERIYLDWNATAPLRDEARDAVLGALAEVGNPSSVHAEGRSARRLIEQAREQVAALVGAEPRNVVFTSGGSEANAMALAPARVADGLETQRLLVSAIEHPSVLAGGRFPPTTIECLPVTAGGQVDLDLVGRRLSEGAAPALVSLMLANNETGVIQPVAEVARLVHAAGGLLHVDAVQGVGRMAFDINGLGADLLTISGHKIGGPKGVGALIRRDGWLSEPLIKGGGQERGMRAGTENVPAIAGFGAAAGAVRKNSIAERERMRILRDHLETDMRAASTELVIFGTGTERLPNTTLFAIPGTKAETAIIALDLGGVAVSSGAACSSGKVKLSHVLAAMGVPARMAGGAIRVSLGATTTEDDIDAFLQAWIRVSEALFTERRGIAA